MFGNKFSNDVNLEPDEFEKLMNDNEHVLIDVRTKQEYDQARIADCKLMDFYLGEFAKGIKDLDKNGKYLIYCRSGNRSLKTAMYMLDNGFTDVKHLAGGIVAWHGSGKKIIS